MKLKIKSNKYNFNNNNIFITVGFERVWYGDKAPLGWVFLRGQLLLRSEYQSLYDWAEKHNLIVADDDWNTNKKYGLFSYGDNLTTFRIPDKRGMYDVGYEPDYHSALGTYQQDQFQAHKHTTTTFWWDYPGVAEEGRGKPDYGNHRQRPTDTIIADGENGTPRTGTRTQPRSIPCNYIIKY